MPSFCPLCWGWGFIPLTSKQINLKPKQLCGSLPIDIALSGKYHVAQLQNCISGAIWIRLRRDHSACILSLFLTGPSIKELHGIYRSVRCLLGVNHKVVFGFKWVLHPYTINDTIIFLGSYQVRGATTLSTTTYSITTLSITFKQLRH
jgi:hypothetical protein